MTEVRIPLSYRPLPQQQAFRESKAQIRGFGGAMGGGKTRALCEQVFDWMLEHPGIAIAVVRQKHTAIVDTTRKTFLEQVLPAELRTRKDLVRIKKSQGEDLVEFLFNGSIVHFVGLDDPGRFFSAEYGAACFDEAHEIKMKDVLTVNTRLRQRCVDCTKEAATYADPENMPDCDHYPHSIVCTFNPSYPGHWLQTWFILGAERTEWGWRKGELIVEGASGSIGDAEFFISRATDNKYLPEKYIKQNLGGMTDMERRRYLDGLWEHVSGTGFFDQEALSALTQAALELQPLLVGEPTGDPTGEDEKNKPRLIERKLGRLEVWKAPVRLHIDKNGDEVKAQRYVVAIDSSSGTSADYSGIQVISIEDFEQVAEWQGKIDPDRLAEIAFLIGCVYNGALMAPEITGGWGFAVAKRLQSLMGRYKGHPSTKPRIYTRPIRDRISQRWTDMVGWDTQTKSRSEMLLVLEEVLRDGSLKVNGQRTLAELAAFAFGEPNDYGEYRSPRAQQGAHDDLVIPLAIGTAIASRLPRQIRDVQVREYVPEFAATGF
jgi:hypothetical protein